MTAPETYEDAIRAAVAGIGGSTKAGKMLWPTMDDDAARRKLAAKLDPDKREVLSPSELRLIRQEARRHNCHALADWEARDAGYVQPLPKDPDEHRADLLREYQTHIDRLDELRVQLEATRNATRLQERA